MKAELIQLGFSEHEADVYLALIDIGQTGAGEIIKRTDLHRNIVYDTLDKLIFKKLVFKVVQKNIAVFEASDPERILAKQKMNLEMAKQIVPNLRNRAQNKHEIVVYDGLEGFRTFSMNYIETLDEGETVFVLGSVGDRWYGLMGDKLKSYMKVKNKKKISWKMVSFEGASKLDKENISENKLDSVRLLTQDIDAPANTLIWRDRIALNTFVEPYSVVEIKNKALADSYLNYFNALWKQGENPVKQSDQYIID